MFSQLKEIIIAVNDEIISTERKEHYFRINTRNGAVINLYSNNNVTFQGNKQAKEKILDCYKKNGVGNENYLSKEEFIENEKLNQLSEFLSQYSISEVHQFFISQREKLKYHHQSDFSDEDELKSWFIENFNEWFYIYSDVEGTTKKNGQTIIVRADFIILAKPELKNTGIDSYLGIEVKYLNARSGFCTKTSNTVFQTLSYSYSNIIWNINGNKVKTHAFLVFTNLSFTSEKNKLFETYDGFYRIYWRALFSMAYHADVGELMINNSRKYFNSWYMSFSGSNYCSWNKLDGIKLSNKNVINKNRVGNVG